MAGNIDKKGMVQALDDLCLGWGWDEDGKQVLRTTTVWEQDTWCPSLTTSSY